MDKLLAVFIKEPERAFHVRELAGIVKKSPTTISKHLKRLQKKGILVSERKLNHLLFKANTDGPLFKEIKRTQNIRQLQQSGCVTYLKEQYHEPEAIILFGSYAKGEDGPRSDIDLLVITPLKKEHELKRFEKRLGKPIQLFLKSREDVEKMKIKNKELLNNWINGIVIEGYWEVFT